MLVVVYSIRSWKKKHLGNDQRGNRKVLQSNIPSHEDPGLVEKNPTAHWSHLVPVYPALQEHFPAALQLHSR